MMKISKITTVLACAFALCCLAVLPPLTAAAAEKNPEDVFVVKDGEWALQAGGETSGTNGADLEQGIFWYAVDPENDEAAKGLQQGILLYNAAAEEYSFLPTTEEQTWVEGVTFSPDGERMVLSCKLNRFSSGLFVYNLPALTLEKSFWGHSDVWFIDEIRFAFTLVDQKLERPEEAGMWGRSAAVYDPAYEVGYLVIKGATKTQNFTVSGAEFDAEEIAVIVTTVKAEKDWEEVEKQEDSEIKVDVPAAG